MAGLTDVALFRGLKADVRQGIRGLRREFWPTLAIALTLGIGIGATTAVFGVFHFVLFRPVPGVSSEREAVTITFQSAKGTVSSGHPSVIPAMRTAAASGGLTQLGYSCCGGRVAVTAPSGTEPSLLGVEFISSQYFRALGVRPAVGRLLTDAEADSESEDVAVISQRLWLSRLEGVDSALGRRIAVNGHSFVVVGVAERFRGWGRLTRVGETDVWLPFGSQRRVTGQSVMSDPVGRIAAGSSLDLLQERLQGAYAEASRALPARYGTFRPIVNAGLFPSYRSGETPTHLYWPLMGPAALLLLLAGANATGLLLARASRRGRESVVRIALGASRARLLRKDLVESFGLAVFAWVLGVLVAVLIVAALQGMRLVETFPDFGDIRFDVAVLLFGAAVTGMIVLAAGALPAILTTGRDVRELLSRSGRTATPRLLLRQGFLIAQIALSLVLLVGSAVLNRSVTNLLDTSLGMDVDRVIELELKPDDLGYDRARSANVLASVVESLRSSDFRDVAVSYGNPLTSSGPIALRTSSMTEPRQTSVLLTSVSPDYFHVLGIPVLAGRSLTPAEYGAAESVEPMPVILNSVMAHDLFADGPAVGQVFELQRFVGASKFVSAATVVGVVGDTRSSAVREPPRPALYHGRTPSLRFGTILVRADASEDVLRRVRGIVRQVDPAVPVATLRPLRDKVIERISEDRVQARLSAIQALLAVLLGAAGIFAVVGQHVSERTRDFGIRSALGASTSQIVRQALRPVIRAAALGVGLGLLLYWLLSRWLETSLFGLKAFDGFVVTVSVVALIGVVLFAALLSASGALRTDIAKVLNTE